MERKESFDKISRKNKIFKLLYNVITYNNSNVNEKYIVYSKK